MSEVVLKAKDISLSFGGLEAVKLFSMELRKGEIRGIIGPNGAGKTTIFNIISRIYNHNTGSVELAGEVIDNMDQIKVARLGLSRTFQNTRLFQGLSVLDNVRVALDFAGGYSIFEALLLLPRRFKYERSSRQRAMDCLSLLGLEEYANRDALTLPYGIQRRVEIARALAVKPKVLMLDEPAAGLNSEELFQLIDFIKGIVQRDPELAILVIEHRMDLIMKLCSFIYVQDFGISIAGGKPAEIQNDPAVLAAYLGEEGL